MAVAWPAALPAPQRSGLRIVPTPDAKARLTQSGRKEVRRWGKGGGDTITCNLRLWSDHPDHGDQVATFKRFWDLDLNFGLNWIDADWLETGLGYSGYYLCIIGYSPLQAQGTLYSDYSVTFSVKTMLALWADTVWPAGSLAQGPYDFGAAAVWAMIDVGRTGVFTGPLAARNISSAIMYARTSGTSANGYSGPSVSITASPPYWSVYSRTNTSHNNYSHDLYTTVSFAAGDKSIHAFFYSTATSTDVGFAASADGAITLGVRFTSTGVSLIAFNAGGNGTTLTTVPLTMVQTHGVSGRYVVSILYNHSSRSVRLFVEGVEIYTGTAPGAMAASMRFIFNPITGGASLYSAIVENACDERSVQAAIDFFNTL